MRTVWNISIVFSILYLPWWLSLALVVGACLSVPKFYESLFYGLLIDTLYGTKSGLYGLAYVFTGVSVLIFFTTAAIRERVLW